MADPVNLNRFRKRKRREDKQREAERNRVAHGRSKAEKRAARLERERAERTHLAHRREGAPLNETGVNEVVQLGERGDPPEPEEP